MGDGFAARPGEGFRELQAVVHLEHGMKLEEVQMQSMDLVHTAISKWHTYTRTWTARSPRMKSNDIYQRTIRHSHIVYAWSS